MDDVVMEHRRRKGRKKHTPKEERCELYRRTRELLRADERNYAQISAETDIPFSFLINISVGRASDPSVHRIQKLYEYLKGEALVIK